MTRPTDPRDLDLDALRAAVIDERGGAVDDSIPQLADADPDLCGVAVVLPDGTTLATEQADVGFSIQ